MGNANANLRDLPDLKTFGAQIIKRLELDDANAAAVSTLEDKSDWPSAAIAINGQHVILLRDHKHSITISLPVEGQGHWVLRTREEFGKNDPTLERSVNAFRREHAGAITMADVIVAIVPLLKKQQQDETWKVDFPGTLNPSEVWIRSDSKSGGDRSIGLFQADDTVRIVIWADSMKTKIISKRSQLAETGGALEALGSWLTEQLVRQVAVADERVKEEARKKALPLPKLDAIMTALRSGARIATGGGRCFTTYYIEDGKIMREMFDEGYTDVADSSEADIEWAIEHYPDAFRSALATPLRR